MRMVSKKRTSLERKLVIFEKLGLKIPSGRKETVSLRGMAKALVAEEELDLALVEAKRSLFRYEQ